MSSSLVKFYVSAILIVAPWLYFTLPLSRVKKPQTGSASTNQTRVWLALLVAVHSLYALFELIVHAPYNIFTELDVSIAEPSDVIRAILLHSSSIPDLSPDLNALLNRLRAFDMREKYILYVYDPS